MANATGHMIAGGVTGAAVLVYQRRKEDKQIEPSELGLAIFTGVAFGLLPDLLEPATSPNHRALFHSLVFAGIIAWVLYQACSDENGRSDQKLLLKLIAAAYASHLLLDARTPMGLPILGAR